MLFIDFIKKKYIRSICKGNFRHLQIKSMINLIQKEKITIENKIDTYLYKELKCIVGNLFLENK